MNNIYTFKPSGNVFRCNEVLGIARNELRQIVNEMNSRGLDSNISHRVVDSGATHIVVMCLSNGNNRIEINSSYVGEPEQRPHHRERILHCRMILTLAGDTDDIVTDPQYVAVEPIPVSTNKVLVDSIINTNICCALSVSGIDNIEMPMEDTIPIIKRELQCNLVKKKGKTFTSKKDYRNYDIADPSTFNKWSSSVTGDSESNKCEIDGYATRYEYSNDYLTRFISGYEIDAPIVLNESNVVRIVNGEKEKPITLDSTFYSREFYTVGWVNEEQWYNREHMDAGDGYVNKEPLWGRYSNRITIRTQLTHLIADFRHIPDLGVEMDEQAKLRIRMLYDDGSPPVDFPIKSINLSTLFAYRVEIKDVETIYDRIGRDFAGNPDSFLYTRSGSELDEEVAFVDIDEDVSYPWAKIKRQKPMMWMVSPGNNYFDIFANGSIDWYDSGYVGHESLRRGWDKMCAAYSMNWLLHPYINNTWFSSELPNIVYPPSSDLSLTTHNPLNKTVLKCSDYSNCWPNLSYAINPAPPNRIVLCIRSFFPDTENATTLQWERIETLVELAPTTLGTCGDTPTSSGLLYHIWGYSPFNRKVSSETRTHIAETSPPLDYDKICSFVTTKGDVVEVTLLSCIYAIGNFKTIEKTDFDLSDRHSGFNFPLGINIRSVDRPEPSTLSALPTVVGSNIWPKYLDCDWEYKNAYSAGVYVGGCGQIFIQKKSYFAEGSDVLYPIMRNEDKNNHQIYQTLVEDKSIYDEDKTLESLLVNSIYAALEKNGYDKYHPICDIKLEANLYDKEVYDDTGEVVQ